MKLMKLTKSTVQRIDEEEALKIMGDEAPMGLCITQDGRFCCFNSNFPVATGYTADELVGKDSLEIVVPEDREMVRENTIKMLKGKLKSPYQFRVTNKDGSIIWVMATVKSIQYQGRRAVLGNYMEITERKQLEEALKEREEQYKELADSITDVFFAMDDHLRYTYWNKASEVLTGIRAEDAIGKSLREVFPDTPERRNSEKVYRNVLKTRQPQTFVNDFDIEGRHYTFEISAYPSRGGISVFVKDITERKQAEEKLKESEQKYRLLFETSPDYVTQFDREGRYIAANPATAKSLGVPLEELVGKTVFEVMPQEVAQLRLRMARKALDKWQPQIFEDERAGRYFHHMVVPTKISGQKEAVQVITRDVTERRKMEESLRQSEEKYKALFDSSVIGMFVLDAETMKIVMCNQAAAKMFGFSSVEEAIGINPVDFIVPEEKDRDINIIMKDMFEQDLRQTHEFQVVTKDGRKGWISATGARIMHEGRLAGLVSITNINRRKQAEEKLKESEQKYRTILEEMGDSYFEVDLAGNVTFVNDALIRILGYSKEEIMGMNYRVLRPKEEAKALFEAYSRVYKTGEPLRDLLTETICKDGGHVLAETSVFPIRSDKGEIIGFRGVGRDLTERKQAEEALRQSEEKYKALFDSSVIGTIVLDAETMKIVMVNKAAAKMFGFGSVEEALGVDGLAFILPEDKERVLELAIKHLFEDDSQQAYELETVTKDGRKIWINATGARIMHEGKLAGLISFTDITERKQAEEALRKSEERYRTILEEMEESYFESDLSGHFTFVNNSACRDLGYSREELMGRSYKDHTAEDDIESVFRVYNEVYRTGMPNKGFPGKIIRKDGSQMFAETSISPLRNDKGEIIGFRGVGRDVTERKQTEEALRQSEEKYRTILEEMEDAYSEVDLGGHLTFVNNSVCRDLGYSREELMGMSYKGFTVEDDIESVFRAFNEVYRTGVPNKGFPWKTTRKDGTQGFAETSVSPLRNSEGEIIGFRSVGRDVSERKETEEKLRQSRERYRALFDSSVIGTLVVDAETMKVVIGNQAAEKIFGVAEGEGAGLNVLDFIPPEDRERDLELLKKELFEQDSRRAFDVRAITKDSREIWISMTGARIMHGGRLAGLLSFTDITERKQTEEKLRQSEENYKTLFDSSVIGMYVLDAETMKVVMGNRASREMVGLKSEQEGIGINPFDFVVPEDREKVLETAINEFFQDSHRTFEVQVIDKNGRRGWQSFSSARIMHKGRFASLVSVMDITERKQAEEALRQSEEKYRALFNSAVVGMFVLDAETIKVVMANQAAAKAFGFGSVEETTGVKPLDFISSDDREKAAGLIAKDLLAEDLRTTHEFQAVTKDGRAIWISMTGARIVHEGKLAGLLSFTDITERKQAEEKLQQSKENYRALFDSSVIGALVVDAKTMKVVMANEATLKMFGFSFPEAGVNPFDFIPPEDRKKNLELVVNEVFGKDSRKSIDIQAVTKDGRKIWVSVTGARIMQKGKLAGLFSFTDITERKQAEEALRQSEENYRTLFDSSVIGTVLLDAETMKIAMVNQAAVKLFGFSSEEEVLGIDPFSFVLPEDREKYLGIATKALFEENSHEPFEIRAVGKDGREKWINATATVITHKGKLTGLISFADITEQKQQRERLMMTDRLASLGELASGTAHELNNPLTSIIGFSQLLMEKEVTDDIREDLKLINNEAQRAASVTKNLLTFARKHAPAKQLNRINNIIEDVLKLRAYEHKVNAIEVERQLDPDLPEIMVDYFQMQQVFMNIIINAEYFMTKAHNKGTLTITTKKRNDTVIISIADDGPGISPENLRRIFDPFFTTKETGKGTGLGLSICHGIVTEHGGQIYAGSQLGKGATFFVELPINGS